MQPSPPCSFASTTYPAVPQAFTMGPPAMVPYNDLLQLCVVWFKQLASQPTQGAPAHAHTTTTTPTARRRGRPAGSTTRRRNPNTQNSTTTTLETPQPPPTPASSVNMLPNSTTTTFDIPPADQNSSAGISQALSSLPFASTSEEPQNVRSVVDNRSQLGPVNPTSTQEWGSSANGWQIPIEAEVHPILRCALERNATTIQNHKETFWSKFSKTPLAFYSAYHLTWEWMESFISRVVPVMEANARGPKPKLTQFCFTLIF
ncbi:hypothetical protein Pelo_18471 [Pelomyxa schiedti]|nr:hypothetical protein Pelo_18471 [Pelomyxa schiedti]